MRLFGFLSDNIVEIFDALKQHFVLASLPVLASLVLAIPIGILFSKYRRIQRFFEHFSDVSKTIPIMSVFTILIYLVGVGTFSTTIVLFIYSIFPIADKIAIGLERLTPQKVKAIKKLGLNRWQIISLVGIPITLPYAIDGLRASLIRSIALVNFAAFFGVGGLGVYIFRGIAVDDLNSILIGTIFSVLLGLIIHFILKALQNLLTARGMKKKENDDVGEK